MVFPSGSMFTEVVRTPGESHESNSVGLGVAGLTRPHSLFRASASGSGCVSSDAGTESTGMVVSIVGGFVVVTVVELDDGAAEFSELHADNSRQLAIATTDNFFTVTFFTGSLLFERHVGGRRKPVAFFVDEDHCKPVLAFFDARDFR